MDDSLTPFSFSSISHTVRINELSILHVHRRQRVSLISVYPVAMPDTLEMKSTHEFVDYVKPLILKGFFNLLQTSFECFFSFSFLLENDRLQRKESRSRELR